MQKAHFGEGKSERLPELAAGSSCGSTGFGKFVRAFDADAPGDRIAATLRELVGQSSARTNERVR